MKSIACLLLATSAVHGLRLSAQEKVDLQAKLEAWKASQAGKQAEANGFLPPKTEHGNLEDGEIDDELLRFATTQKIVDDLNKQHKGAVFSTDNQFALMTEDEFAAFKTKVSVGKSVDIQGESALQSALDKQPVTVVVEAGNNVWRNYKSGVVQSCPGAQSDHAVIAVGYGTKDGQQHFKIKNSWGTGWGEQGYIYLKRGVSSKGMCNVAEMPSYPALSGKSQPSSEPQPPSKPTKMPHGNCNGCNGCYYPAASQCLTADYDKKYCEYLAPEFGTQWCTS
ncbi:hypothetical protein SDRG_04623 [Saprolegnia diclina VS20]|uniref:Peptidase C1A papain C-terminal domain-containing protein n=1 Tax=Saprolegnia diclina (strain VS20) TaxID=1156394 RepID=T0QVX7_SAPDV|nr:hypothetical protein SDRG_04623 [Saprolegnia diclina VS20]EQC38195.1 hypothetical protein SDRG_04623 [Saprolegnia diclina VS20]|eukprot:XP_008608522.1 hypothetical protein SDRG_04623 [Saprolegnia diclina VS20]